MSLPMSGKWFRFPPTYLYLMSADEAVLLSYISNLENIQIAKRAHNKNISHEEAEVQWFRKTKGWIFCRRDKTERDLNFKIEKQKHLFRSLVGKNYLETKQAPKIIGSTQRYVRININALRDANLKLLEELGE